MTGAEIITAPEVTVTGTGLDIPAGISRSRWEEVGESLSRVDKALQFMIGDWINAGISKGYVDSDSYDTAQRLFPHLSRKTLQEYAYVARSSSIRMEELSFGHHQAVAALPAEVQQERLEEARYHEWPVSKLRARLARDHGDHAVDAVRDLVDDLGPVGTITALDRWFHGHHILATDEKVAEVEAVCEIASVKPMIEDLRGTASTIDYIWVGYITVDMAALGQAETDAERAAAFINPMTFHPGWAKYCRHYLGDGVRWATENMMPPVCEAGI